MAFTVISFSPEMGSMHRRYYHCDIDSDRNSIPTGLLTPGDCAYVQSTNTEWFVNASLIWKSRVLSHSDLTGIGATDHHSNVNDHAQSHTHASHTGIGASDHHSNVNDHAQLHASAHTAGGGDIPNVLDPSSELRAPRKTDPVTPSVGEIWVNLADVKVRDNQAIPATQTLERQANKGVANGYASLDAGGTVPDAQITAGITRDSEHGGFSPLGHHDLITLAVDADILLGITGQQLTLDTQLANVILAGPASGVAADPTFRALVDADIPAAITRDSEHGGFTPLGHHTAFVQADHDVLPNPHHAQVHTLSGADHTGQLVEAQTPLTTKGALLVSDGITLQRVAVGADTQVLTADSTLANGVKWAAGGGGGGAWTTKIKTADQTNNTATLVDDTVLQFNTVANTQYTIRLLFFGLTNATADMKYRLVHTGTTTRVRRRIRRTSTTDIAQIFELKTAFDAADVVLSTTGLNPNFSEEIILQVGATGGVFKVQWAQVILNAGPTSCLEGSYLEQATA